MGLRTAVRDRERHDLVEDQHDPMPGGDLAEPLQELGGRRNHPGGTGDRLDDHGGELTGMLGDHRLGAIGVVERELDDVLRDAGGDSRRHDVADEADRRLPDHEDVRDAVVAPAGLAELRSARVGPREAEGEQVRLGP